MQRQRERNMICRDREIYSKRGKERGKECVCERERLREIERKRDRERETINNDTIRGHKMVKKILPTISLHYTKIYLKIFIVLQHYQRKLNFLVGI